MNQVEIFVVGIWGLNQPTVKNALNSKQPKPHI